jgi:DegV family protein with EDD domain
MGDNMEYINGNDLYQMFNYGTYYIMRERIHLNDINVFPVADGDTGNNLLQTLKTIVVESKKHKSFTKSLESISDSALIGARGNSGVIFAQFVNGLLKANKEYSEVSFEQFAELVSESYEHTHASLSNPVEGTMLTVMREFGSIMTKTEDKKKPLRELFHAVHEKMKTVLQNTKKMLDVLTQNDVVDSGALGFVLFVEGIVSYYNKDEVNILEYEEVEITDQHNFEGEITYQYCTEGLVSSENLEETVLRHELEPLGDSIIIAEGKSRFRVHIHTNTPELVFDRLKEYGTIETQKIDNMKLEMTLKNSNQKRVLVTDSIADIDPKILEENNVVVIPINIGVEGIPYLDKLSINNKLLFSNMDRYLEYPKTATPTIKYINDLFSRLLLQFDEIVVITVSKDLSGTHDVIKSEADKLTKKGKKIIVFDSYNNSATEGLIVNKAIELFNSKTPTEEIVKQLEEYREKTRILVCLESFKYATMSGRVPKVIGNIGMLFGLRPIMSLKEGKGTAFGMSLSKKGITKKIVKLVKSDMEKNGIDSYSIVHCLNEELAKEYEGLFTEIIGKRPEYITEISSATAIHSGVGSVAIGYITK